MAKQKFYAIRFSVTGSGRFPIDMLRYDSAVPYAERDADEISRRVEDDSERTVNLIAFTPLGRILSPTWGRWHSFGWRCSEAQEVQA